MKNEKNMNKKRNRDFIFVMHSIKSCVTLFQLLSAEKLIEFYRTSSFLTKITRRTTEEEIATLREYYKEQEARIFAFGSGGSRQA